MIPESPRQQTNYFENNSDFSKLVRSIIRESRYNYCKTQLTQTLKGENMTQLKDDLSCLKYASLMGHRFVLIREYKGAWVTAVHLNTIVEARDPKYLKDGYRIFQRQGKSWKEVPTA